jgi:hypothetical protein
MTPFPAGAEEQKLLTTPRDRRAGHRYEVSLKLRWKVSRRKRLLETGTGMTIDLSSGGVLFEPDRKLPTEGYVELSISWPVLLNDSLPMQLIVSGRVVRVAGERVAIQIEQHEFRTAGAAASAKFA